jgi:TRAP-type C4-dicarboxylate transport system substrate-binding protein
MSHLMTSLSRILPALLLSLATLLPFSALAETFKVATISPNGSAWMTLMKEAADQIAKETDNRVVFRFYPGGVMGSDSAVLKKIRMGQLQGAVVSGGALATQAPDTQIYNIPLLFNTYAEVDHVRKLMDGDIEKSFEDAGFVNFGLVEGGFAYIMSKKPIADADQLRQNKVWAPSDDAAARAAADTFHFTPTTLAIGDVLTGLQTDMINTITSSPIAAIALQWHTQVNYITDLPIAYFYALMAIDKKAFAKIAPDDQKIVRKVMRDAFRKMDAQNRKDNQEAFTALQKQGIKMVTPTAAQIAVWREKTREAARIFAEKGGISAKFQEKLQQSLATYRNRQVSAAQ